MTAPTNGTMQSKTQTKTFAASRVLWLLPAAILLSSLALQAQSDGTNLQNPSVQNSSAQKPGTPSAPAPVPAPQGVPPLETRPAGGSGPYATAPQQATALPPSPYAVPEGTTFLIRLDDKLDTNKLQPGKRFKAKLEEDLQAPNGKYIPRGKKVYGHVSSVERGLHTRMLLSFDEIETEHGKMSLIATVTGVPGEHGIQSPDAEGRIQKKGVDPRHEMEDIAVGAAIGALGGAAVGGGKGAGIGVGTGAALGAAAGLFADRDLRLEKGTALEVRLDRDLEIPSR